MSSFIKDNLKEMIDNLNTESVSLPDWLNTEKSIDSSTSPQISENFVFSATSNNMVGGGILSSTSDVDLSSNYGKNEVNQLVSMLTSESQNNVNASEFDTIASMTSTEDLEAELRKLLQSGGAKKSKKEIN